MTSQTPVAEGGSGLAGIVPRWEWRTFGESFGEADERLGAMETDRVQESDEVYLLSLESDASVKVRDGLMDVKQLEHVNEDGVEQCRPVMKAASPIPASDVSSLLAILGVEPRPLGRDAYTLDQLVEDVVHGSETLRIVK